MGRLERELDVLNAIGAGDIANQRALAERLGIALGLANLYLRRLARDGCIKVSEFPRKPGARKRLRYLLTERGIAEKTRLTYTYMDRSLSLYRYVRAALREALSSLPSHGRSCVALYGTGEAAELAYLTLRELGVEPIGVFDRVAGATFLGMPVRDVQELASEPLDCVILATFEEQDLPLSELVALGIAATKILTLTPVMNARAYR